MKAKFFFAIAVLAACLCSCNMERVVDSVEGTWQLDNAKIIARTLTGETIEATSAKELLLGTVRIIQSMMSEEDKEEFTEIEEEINKMDDIPFSFTEEDNSFRLQFSKDGSFRAFAKDDDGKWVVSDQDGEYSYAGYRLTMYFQNEDGTQSQTPCTIVKLTNKHFSILVKLADMFQMPVGNPMAGGGEDYIDTDMDISMLFNILDLTTELNFNKV